MGLAGKHPGACQKNLRSTMVERRFFNGFSFESLRRWPESRGFLTGLRLKVIPAEV